MIRTCSLLSMATLSLSLNVSAELDDSELAAAEVIANQRAALARSTAGKGFGPQSPRDIDASSGRNTIVFATAPAASEMDLCNIHFHSSAEHAGGEFNRFAGNGDGKGHQTGYQYSGELTAAESKQLPEAVCRGKYRSLQPGDTIEVHYVHTTARTEAGPTLLSCLSETTSNPQLRVEAQVMVLVNDKEASDFRKLALVSEKGGLSQATNIPDSTESTVVYAGSTTGPSFNETGSPLQVTWAVRPQVLKVDAASVGEWCKDNIFDEDHAHASRNLIKNADLLSPID